MATAAPLNPVHRTLLALGTFVVVIGGLLLGEAPARASSQEFPMIRNVAVIPFQWQGTRPDSYRWQELYQQFDQDFFSAVKASNRFHLINPQVSDDLWSTPRGRRTLVDRYELQSYFNLTATENSGGVKIVARLLSPALNNVFLESWTVDTRSLLGMTPEQLRERLTDLTFRLINRFPLDARVTSVQGQFVTLSAGRNLGIGSKERFPVYRVAVAAINPATGGPESFSRKQMGWVEVIDSRQFTAIARIVRQNSEGAIASLDGIFIPTMTTRARFPEENHIETEPAPVIPLPAQTPAPVPAPIVKELPPAPPAAAPAAVEPVARSLQPVDIGIGAFNFRLAGDSSTSSIFPSSLINSIRLGTRMAVDAATQWEVEISYASGLTKNGRYTMIDGQAVGSLHQSEPNGTSLFPNWYWGLFIGYRSMGVRGAEAFGGFDVLSVGGAAGVYSNYRGLSPEMLARLSIDLNVSPLGFGQVGFAGEKNHAASYLGLGATVKLLMQPKGSPADGLWFGPRADVDWQKFEAGNASYSTLSTLFSAMVVLAF